MWRPQQGRQRLGFHQYKALLSLNQLQRALSADSANLTLEVSQAGLAGVAPDDLANRFFRELNIDVQLNTALLGLAREKVLSCDDEFLLFGVTVQLDDFHAIQ